MRREGPLSGPPGPDPPLAPGEDEPSGPELAGGSLFGPFPSPGPDGLPSSPVIVSVKLESVEIFLGV